MPKSNRTHGLLQAAKKEIRRRQKLLTALAQLDPVIAETAYHTFGSEDRAAEWILSPTFALAGKIPVIAVRTRSGRKAVIQNLIWIDRGIF